MIDMIFIEVIPSNVKSMFKSHEQVEPGQVAWKMIEYYSEFPLARLIFLLPLMHSASEAAKKSNKAVVVAIEDALVQIHKGVENVLFDAYNDIPEGGLLDGKIVIKKLRSLIGL